MTTLLGLSILISVNSNSFSYNSWLINNLSCSLGLIFFKNGGERVEICTFIFFLLQINGMEGSHDIFEISTLSLLQTKSAKLMN